MNLSDPQVVGMSAERLRRLDSWLEKQVSIERFAGSSLLLGRHGHIAYYNAFGYSELEAKKTFQELPEELQPVLKHFLESVIIGKTVRYVELDT